MKEKMDPNTYFEAFKQAQIGRILNIPISLLVPSQPDDGRRNSSVAPIEVCLDNNRILIVHGNHRYWHIIRDNREIDTLVTVKRVSNPYLDY